ncbi:hypothetical protein [Mycobacterium sp. URHB0044]|jgi:hypothetical protein|uniref:hypothetical protein n=1 Tax=Mycobacterium sp. URHB0044 TaxID=1380386 RepID=UPI00048D52A3|nr:hypothetical protein [Mycobacterium sp. URHB0044]
MDFSIGDGVAVGVVGFGVVVGVEVGVVGVAAARHASITVTAHVYADLYDDELDVVASALDALDDRPSE